MSIDAWVMRASVYRIAAGGSPSIEPKFPWGSTTGVFIFHFCAIPTMVG